ncbi:MAG: hypothetical protein ACLUPK_08945 [Veillonella sp.]
MLQALLDGRDDVINYVMPEELFDQLQCRPVWNTGRVNLINMMTNFDLVFK